MATVVTMSETASADDAIAAAPAQVAATKPSDPWERYGWIMSSIWLVFLAFPLYSAFNAPTAGVWRLVAVALLLVFGFVYAQTFAKMTHSLTQRQYRALGLSRFLILIGLAVATIPMIGWNAVGVAPFLVAFSSFFFPTRVGVAVIVGALGLTGLGIVLGGPELWILPAVVLLVGVSTQLIATLDRRQHEHRELSTQVTLSNERDRVARDVHDVLGHSLTAITVKAELAQRLIDIDPQRAREEMAQVQELSRAALGEVRTTVGGLRAARLDDEITTAQVVLADAGIAPQVHGDVGDVDPRHRTVIAWVLREAVTNVVRHSGATSCSIALAADSLAVVDDGRGLNGHRLGNGIRGLSERVEAAGGHLDLGPGPAETGTALRVRL